jgi:hypothetical protein
LGHHHLVHGQVRVPRAGGDKLAELGGKEHTARMVCGVCALSLILNFVFTPNRNYREVTPLQRIYFLDESASFAQDLSNPWILI